VPARILIIEDDDFSRDLVHYLLHSAGYTTLDAVDGGVGLQYALEKNPDLILCDLQMPVMNGYDVIRRLKDNPLWRPVPIVALTAFSMAGDRENALAAGFDEHFSKPITPERFIQQIESLLSPNLRAQSPQGN
jgi:two-component system cell cycle response regulator DivK